MGCWGSIWYCSGALRYTGECCEVKGKKGGKGLKVLDNDSLDMDIVKITKKWPKLDKNEHEIVKSAQKPDPKTFSMHKSQVKSQIETQGAHSAIFKSLKVIRTTSSANNSVFMGFFEKQKVTGPNFINWYRQIRIVLSIEDKLNYLEQLIPPAPVVPVGQHVAPKILVAHTAWIKGSKEIVGLMLMTMEPDIQRNLETRYAHEMLLELKTLFTQQAEHELLQTTRDFHSCKQEEGQSVSSYVLKMKGNIDNLERLGHPVTLRLGVSLIFIGLRKEFDGFMQNYNMHSLGKTINELHAMLKLHEQTLPKNNALALHAIQAERTLEEELSSVLSRVAEEVKEHSFGSWLFRLEIVLNNCHYAPSITRGVIPVSHLYEDGFINRFGNNTIQVSRNNMVYFSDIPRDGYLKETKGYSFYYPPENKVLVAQNVEFLENSLITQEASRSLEDLEIIQEEYAHPSIDTSLNHEEDDLEIDEPQRDLSEPANYKAALLDPKSEKWLNAMNVEMQSMKDNEVWVLVELPSNGKTVGSKWLFKKKTNMDGVMHTYKARLMAKGYTHNPWIDYEETFSPVADTRAIRILIAIAAYYDYEIWQMNVKIAFLNGYLNEEVYMEQPEAFVNPKYPNQGNNIPMLQGVKSYLGRCFAMEDLGEAAYILGIKIYRDRSSIPMQEKLKLSKSQGASTPAKLKPMQNVPYASAVGSIMYVTGYVFILNDGAIDWKSAKQSIFATSSAEAKYIATFDASKEAMWVRNFISGLGVVPTIEEPISMYCDNTGAIAIANKSGITKGARHFRAKVHYLREVIDYGDENLEKVHTNDNLADPFTKALAFPKHSKHTRNIGMLPASSLV
uniref:Zinc finger, CCHC-type n=1 Tax=Tanacetum cinerariifolium TaxID=118510 RepID=A0A6L2KWK6_TANCI|nr:zinc finger, CCHC-type [Tanacetum cinerariifolium]